MRFGTPSPTSASGGRSQRQTEDAQRLPMPRCGTHTDTPRPRTHFVDATPLAHPRRVAAGSRRGREPSTCPRPTPAPPTSAQVGAGVLGGGRGIRTHERREPLAVFKTAALGHYASPPG